MDQSDDPRELERKIEQAARIASRVNDPTTVERLRAWIDGPAFAGAPSDLLRQTRCRAVVRTMTTITMTRIERGMEAWRVAFSGRRRCAP
jgi:hypothetical protein